jgi:uncharacterized protein with HEPN domain
MRIESKKYLYDIAQAVARALDFVAGKSFAAYDADLMLRSAVERQLEIVGEALTQLARIDPTTAAHITEHRRIIAFRNILIHGYAEIDQRIVWGVLETKLPTLRREAESLLGLDSEGGVDQRTKS